MANRRAPSSFKPKLPVYLEAKLVVVAAEMNMTGSEALCDAAQRWIKWAEQTIPRQAYKVAMTEYEAGRASSAPNPETYGLPRDYGIPKL